MSDPSSADPAFRLLNELDSRASALLGHFKKIRERIARYRKAAGTASTPKELAKLVKEIKAFGHVPELPDAVATATALESILSNMRRDLAQSFREELQSSCAASDISFKPLPDGFGLGPFFLATNASKEQASLSYAKVVVAKDLPLNAATCVNQAATLNAWLFEKEADLADIRKSIEEAMRVALARKNKPIHGALRVELPQVYREVAVIRQSDSGTMSGESRRYSMPRFIVELSRLVQSDANLDSKNPLRLETAVLENTKDSSRSIFIPKELTCGFGEGTYYQAITLNTEKSS